MTEEDIPMKYCCGRVMTPKKRQTSLGFRHMWTCGICNYRTQMTREEWNKYGRRKEKND